MAAGSNFDEIFERHRRVLLSATAKSEQEALRNPIESFRFMVLDVERVDETTARILVRFAGIPEHVTPYIKSTDTRVAILSSFVDEYGNPVIVEDPFSDLEEFIATARINDETIIGTEPDGTVVVDGKSEL